ncbi:MAG: MBL fold metallo-hydrolase [Candidatus Pacebacteria bacterium]|nr:MBL fold metallo-hydrolase [Candidatus Paceibacterota bacterium]
MAFVMLASGLAGCYFMKTPVNPDYDASKAHHRPDGFENRYMARMQRPKGSNVFKWMIKRRFEDRPQPAPNAIPTMDPDIALIQDKGLATRVSWVGHSTVLLQLDGVNILTDPIWSNRASPFKRMGPKRHQPPGIPFDQLPHIDLVLISHNHYDHLDEATVQRLMKQPGGPPRFIVPLGVNYWFREEIKGAIIQGEGQNVFALDWDQTTEFMGKTAPLKIELLAVQHWSARGLGDRYETLWGSYAVLHPKFRFWFSGDLGYSKDTKDIGAKIGGFDLAAIAIGAYNPPEIMKRSHTNPAEAVQVRQDVKAKQAFGIHWGTFAMADEPLDQPPQFLAKARADAGISEDQFFVFKHGQTMVFEGKN